MVALTPVHDVERRNLFFNGHVIICGASRYGVGSPGTSASEQHNDNTQGALPQGLVDHSNFRQHFEKIFGKD